MFPIEAQGEVEKASFLLSWKFWGWFLSALFIVTVLYVGIHDSYVQKSAKPFLQQVGGRLVAPDIVAEQQFNHLINESNTINEKARLDKERIPIIDKTYTAWVKIREYSVIFWKFFSSIWIIGFMLYLFYILFRSMDSMSPMKNLGFAILTMVILQTFYKVSLLITDDAALSSILLIVSLGLTALLIYIAYNSESKTFFTILISVIVVLAIIGTLLSVFIDNTTIKSIGESLIPFKGIIGIIRTSYGLLVTHKEALLNVSNKIAG